MFFFGKKSKEKKKEQCFVFSFFFLLLPKKRLGGLKTSQLFFCSKKAKHPFASSVLLLRRRRSKKKNGDALAFLEQKSKSIDLSQKKPSIGSPSQKSESIFSENLSFKEKEIVGAKRNKREVFFSKKFFPHTSLFLKRETFLKLSSSNSLSICSLKKNQSISEREQRFLSRFLTCFSFLFVSFFSFSFFSLSRKQSMGFLSFFSLFFLSPKNKVFLFLFSLPQKIESILSLVPLSLFSFSRKRSIGSLSKKTKVSALFRKKAKASSLPFLSLEEKEPKRESRYFGFLERKNNWEVFRPPNCFFWREHKEREIFGELKRSPQKCNLGERNRRFLSPRLHFRGERKRSLSIFRERAG